MCAIHKCTLHAHAFSSTLHIPARRGACTALQTRHHTDQSQVRAGSDSGSALQMRRSAQKPSSRRSGNRCSQTRARSTRRTRAARPTSVWWCSMCATATSGTLATLRGPPGLRRKSSRSRWAQLQAYPATRCKTQERAALAVMRRQHTHAVGRPRTQAALLQVLQAMTRRSPRQVLYRLALNAVGRRMTDLAQRIHIHTPLLHPQPTAQQQQSQKRAHRICWLRWKACRLRPLSWCDKLLF